MAFWNKEEMAIALAWFKDHPNELPAERELLNTFTDDHYLRPGPLGIAQQPHQ